MPFATREIEPDVVDSLVPQRPLFTIRDAAGLVKLSAKTLYAWCDQGDLRFVRVGKRSIRLRREDVLGLMSVNDAS